jgi:transglutaminase-like putative cysteine protease
MTIPADVRTSRRTYAADVAMLIALPVAAASALGGAYGGWHWLLAVIGGLVLGVGVAALGQVFRLGAWPVALLVVAAYFLAGPIVAVPTLGFTSAGIRGLWNGIVESWRDSLTLVTPLGDSGTVLVVPFVLALVAGVAAATLLWRTRWPSLAAVPVIGLFVGAAAFGDQTTGMTLARGLGLASVLLVWMRWRSARHVRAKWSRRIALTGAVVLVAGGAGTAMATVTNGTDHREVLRDYVSPPFDPLDYPSPLSKFRAYVKDLDDTDLMTVKGLPPKGRIRIATMDTYDGIVWNVSGGKGSPTSSGTFKRLVDHPKKSSASDITITIDKFTGVWVPSVGQTDAVRVEKPGGSRDLDAESKLLFNNVTGTVADAQNGGLREGQVFRLTAEVPEIVDPDQIAAAEAAEGAVVPPQKTVPPPKLLQRATSWVALSHASTAGERAQAIAKALSEGYYSDGFEKGVQPSNSGHGNNRLAVLAKQAQMVGNGEQYAAAMGVAAQAQGLPARVVLGFMPKNGQTKLTGSDIEAWVEVDLQGHGWVPFEPTPDKLRTLKTPDKDPNPNPQPAVIQPPDIPKDSKDTDENLPQGAAGRHNSDSSAFLGAIVGAVVTGAKVGLLLSPLWGILLIKFLRRRRRRRDPDPVARMSGGWKEIADGARDLGARVPISHTRYETSVILSNRFPASEVAPLATVADRHVFGPTPPTEDEIAGYWDDVESAVKRMRRAAPLWRRVLSRFSPASIPWHHVRARTVTSITKRIPRRKGRSL